MSETIRTRYEIGANTFQGQAKKFLDPTTNLEEALTNAIQTAKSNLKSELIEWKLHEISGRDRGFTQEIKMVVAIEAWVPKTEPTEKVRESIDSKIE